MWTPDEETDEACDAAYDKGCVTIGGRRLHTRDLDACTVTAYELADLADQDEEFDPNGMESEDRLVRGDLDVALAWAAAGVCVVQQLLPYPFGDVLPYGPIGNQPAHSGRA
ncbi:hypothetical protein [Streptomyces pseudovenezuelae]|uniref:Uncharacterized protein n=1 Tax=Streptomyces pseudovenezuelae TaxID=67350 RepID=A0A101N0P5_9ACTN|nr:hypothetical protein [Streptomyces pseudovenezuelae]KUM84421.1 hypothetical protein AQI94_31570 [Streptomyces pseudovenezuelae]